MFLKTFFNNTKIKILRNEHAHQSGHLSLANHIHCEITDFKSVY